MKVGITGGIGSGKTTVCKLFEALDIPVYHADVMAKKLMVSQPDIKLKIKSLLSREAYYSNGRPNRAYIASKVFGDRDLLNHLNEIIHPAVQEDFEKFYQKHALTAPYVLNEAALLVENGSYTRFDYLIVVTCPEEIRVKRIMQRDNISREAVFKRIQNQLPEQEKVAKAHQLIDNSGRLPLIPQVWKIHQYLISIKKD